MKYLVRAVKYFLYICSICAIALIILVLIKAVSPDINVMFRNGWKSVEIIAGMFAAVAPIYPLFGFGKRQVSVLGDYADLRGPVVEFMESRGYKLESENEEKMTFRSRSVVSRILRMCEDRITLEKVLGGFRMEGLSREIGRLVYGLEYKFRNPEENS